MQVLNLFGDAIRVALTQKKDGNMYAFSRSEASQVAANHIPLFDVMDIDRDHVLRLPLTYNRPDFCRFVAADSNYQELPLPTDGVYTRDPRVALMLTPADCLSLVTYDTKQRALMLTHCGRHGLEQNAAAEAIHFMERQGSNPQDIHAWLSPSAGKGKYPLFKLDNQSMQEAAIGQLVAAGVPDENIIKSDVDTTTSSDYFSHSQGDKTERFAVVARIV